MKTRTKNIIEGTFGKMQKISNFLPKPEDIVLKKPVEKISLTLDVDTIDFFKRKARRSDTTYQDMIRLFIQKHVEAIVREKMTVDR